MKRHLSPEEEDEEAFKAEMYDKLDDMQAAAVIAAAHRPNRALQDLSNSIEALPMHFVRKNEIHQVRENENNPLGSNLHVFVLVCFLGLTVFVVSISMLSLCSINESIGGHDLRRQLG